MGSKTLLFPLWSLTALMKPGYLPMNFNMMKKAISPGLIQRNLLSQNNGKPRQIEALNLEGEIYVLGDGYTDYEIKKAGIAHKFYAFTENVRREKVLENADHEAPTLDEFLYVNNMGKSSFLP